MPSWPCCCPSVASPIGLGRAVGAGTIKGLCFVPDVTLPAEGYSIVIGKKAAVVSASDYSGFFYAVQTIKQMLPVSIYGKTQDLKGKWYLPCCEIKDSPRFGYRGLLLDCCRHFFSVEQVKKVIDVMSIYKLNRLHWHLTEDQGWRIEIDKYPKLTEIGAFRNGTMIKREWGSNDGIRHGGFYTKDQIRDVVAYAAERGITIIPEVDMPGHMVAALASYPELGCAGSGPYEVRTYWGVSKQVLNVGKESTMKFLEDVCDEVADLFQEVLINLWKSLPSFEERGDVRSWIYRVSLNVCISLDRKKRRNKTVPLTMDIDPYEEAETNQNSHQMEMLRQRIARLGQFDRAIILLWLENMTYEEIAAVMGITVKNVSVRLYRIKEELKNMSNQ